ncbi:MAG TPA: ATP-binding protein, partial [Mucilaginibacter sp.]
HTDYKYLPEELKNRILGEQCLTQCFALAKNSGVGINFHSQRVLSDIETDILKRFSKVFEQSYIRFLDLQRAEAQVREAQVEAALERVRSKTMAMHSSSDVADTTAVMFDELIKLGVEKMVRCGIGILNPDSSKMELWTAKAGKNEKPELVIGHFDMNIHPMLKGIYDSWHKHEPDFSYVLTGDDMVKYFEIINNQPDYPIKYKISELPSTQYQNDFFFAEGALFAFTSQPLSDGISSVFKRFAGVFGQTYRRYLDLQKAEAQTHEAIKQASLDRVRGEIASMRSTEDLERITPLIWNELTILGIPFIRCGVFIVNEEEQLIHTHLSTADGKALATFNLQFDSEGIGRDVLSAWRNKQIATVYWSKEEFATYTSNLVSQGTIQSKERYVTEHPDSSLDLHFFPFLQGMLYVGNIAPLLDDEKDLVQSLADAFSTAYARYEDFNKLEAAKQQVDNALADLKAAQTKLIQSEKMASLGELTAGIAHEIQNPLNFVNNFSEVNQEMIDELEEELKAGNVEEALAIAAGIKQNEEKISHHGKRADGIVKGMLQHSRAGGEKQLTNMNVLVDEFLRLSYHGLRAKDKAFNAEMVTDFDPGLPKISVIAQDMGRVMLNLFNNAFYAVNQKKKTALPDYKPEVSVSTSQENGQVIIKVKDNGTGMPEHVKDKIMQPFFTTKPTGEGTGLGLSLTYDMVVKGHGGSITVNTKEGEGSEFIILLPVN